MEPEWQVIAESDWVLAEEPSKDRAEGARPSFCLEMAPDRSWAAILSAWLRPDGLRQVEITDCREGIGWIPGRFAELKQHEPHAVVVARDSPAASEVPLLESLGIEVTRLGGPDYVAASGMLYDGVAGPAPEGSPTPRTVRHSGQDNLTAGVRHAVKHPPGEKAWSFDRARPFGWVLKGACGALWGLSRPGPEPEQPFFASWR